MRLRSRLQRQEGRIGGDPGCPCCRDWRGRFVFVEVRPELDGQTDCEMPAPCSCCGKIPEFVIEIAEAVVVDAES